MYFMLFIVPALLVTIGTFVWHQMSNKDADKSTHSYYARFREEVTLKELALSIGLNIMIALIGVGMIKMYGAGKAYDTYVVTGTVTEKEKDRVSCEHSYDCNCREVCSGSGDSKSCSTVCDTCYEHSHDYDWVVRSTVGRTEIRRVDRQGTREPERWTRVQIGEAYSDTRMYQNYLQVDPGSLFVESVDPAPMSYPKVNDYYRFNHTVNTSADITKAVREWAKDKRINPLIVVTDKPDSIYFESVMKSYEGGNMNDVVLVYSIDKDKNIQWFDAGTYARGYKNSFMISELVNFTLNQKLTVDLVLQQLDHANAKFQFLAPDEFKEKMDTIVIPIPFIIFIMLLNFAASIGIHVYMVKNDL